jgi:hypothetical protein
MDLDRAILVVCLTVGAVILFNVMIYLSLRRGKGVNSVDMMRKAARRARNPWQDEEDALQELADIVAGLRKGNEKSSSADRETKNDG